MLVLVIVSAFMSALDGSVVNVALPSVRTAFGAEVASMEWVITAYLLCISSLLLPFGQLADRLGYGRMLGTGFLLFGLASVGCGASSSLTWLVVTRGLQGIGAAMLMATGPALVSSYFPPQQRGRALGILATAVYAGLSLGPSIGGLLTGTLGWRWVFWVNIPFSLVGGLAAWRWLGGRGSGESARALDFTGAALFAASIVSGILALEGAGRQESHVTVLLTGGAVLLLTLFLLRQRTAVEPLIPLGLFSHLPFSTSAFAAFLQYVVLFIASFLVPFYLQGPLGLSPQHAGWVMSAQPLCMVSVTAFSGWLSDRIGARGPATAGMVMLAAGVFLLRQTAGSGTLSVWPTVGALSAMGIGAGLFTPPNNATLLNAAPKERQGVASGLLAATRNVGMVTGVALAGQFVAPQLELTRAIERALTLAAALALLGAALSARPDFGGARHR